MAKYIAPRCIPHYSLNPHVRVLGIIFGLRSVVSGTIYIAIATAVDIRRIIIMLYYRKHAVHSLYLAMAVLLCCSYSVVFLSFQLCCNTRSKILLSRCQIFTTLSFYRYRTHHYFQLHSVENPPGSLAVLSGVL